MYAYISALASVVCQSFYLTYIQKSGVEEGLSTLTVLFTNSVNCVPLLLLYTLCNKELFSALAFEGLTVAGFQVCFFILYIVFNQLVEKDVNAAVILLEKWEFEPTTFALPVQCSTRCTTWSSQLLNVPFL